MLHPHGQRWTAVQPKMFVAVQQLCLDYKIAVLQLTLSLIGKRAGSVGLFSVRQGWSWQDIALVGQLRLVFLLIAALSIFQIVTRLLV